MHHFDQNYQYEHEQQQQQQSRFYQQQIQQPKSSEVQNSSSNLNFSVNNNHVQSNLNMVAVTGSQQNMDMCFNSQVSWVICVFRRHLCIIFITIMMRNCFLCICSDVVSKIQNLILNVVFFLFWNLQLGNMNMQNQNNHSFMNNGKNNANMVQMNNMAPLNGMNYNNASRQYLNPQNQQVFILVVA